MRIFYALGRQVYRYRWFVLLIWGALLVSGAFFAPNLSDRLKGGGFEGANSDAEKVQEIMGEEFNASPSTITVVFEGDGLDAGSDEFQEAQNAALDEVRELDEVGSIVSYSDAQDPRFLSESGERSYALVSFEIPIDQAQGLADEVRGKVRSEELTTYVTGAPAVYLDITEASNEDIRRAEEYAFPLALVILILAFGSLVAAGVPVLIGGASVVVTLAALYFVAGIYDMSTFVLTISTMLGLGLGIDYALFAVSRFREELEHGPVSEAVPRTVETAGRSIFFSGTAVLIGLTGLLFFPYTFMRSIGVAGALVVFASVAAALTLLPAVLGVLGPKINAFSVRRRRAEGSVVGAGLWARSAELVMRRPLVVLLVVGSLLFALLYPAMHMKVGVPEASVLPERYESRAGDDILKEDFDYAGLTPIEVVATLPDDPLSVKSLEKVRDLGQRIEETENVERVDSLYTVGEEAAREYAESLGEAREEAETEGARVADEGATEQLDTLRGQYGAVPPGAEARVRAEAERRAAEEMERQIPVLPDGVSADGAATPEGVASVLALPEVRESEEVGNALSFYAAGDRALLRAVTESSPYVEEARDTVGEVRAIEPPEGTSVLVGGLPAGQKDFISNLYGNAPYAVAFVLGVTYIVLFLTFRSIFIPLKAVIVNILSLTASFGAMVFVFQDGNLSGILGFTPLGFVDATLPILMFCTIFGVSMDYEVFLLSRIREAYEEGESNTASVARGLVATAGIITSAAAIIVVVTGAFAFTGIITTKAVGLGLAVAVLVDATIIRVLLVPATMRILGDWNWWPGGRKKSVFRAKSEESRRTTKIIATAAVVAAGVFALTGFVTASLLGFGLAVIVLVNAALICALLLPIAIRGLGKYRRHPGEEEDAFGARPEAGAAPLNGGRPAADGGSPGEELRREDDTQNAVERAECQEGAGDGHPRDDRTLRVAHNAAAREAQGSQGARPRPARAHLDSFRRLGRELRQGAKAVNGGRDGDSYGPEQATREGWYVRECNGK
ncbi:MAG: MMPL family transporter [Actinomycetota bacterium]|nr:MMPL family transporter [Actinomycetota bacterium]